MRTTPNGFFSIKSYSRRNFIEEEAKKIIGRLLSRIHGSVDIYGSTFAILTLCQQPRLAGLPRLGVA